MVETQPFDNTALKTEELPFNISGIRTNTREKRWNYGHLKGITHLQEAFRCHEEQDIEGRNIHARKAAFSLSQQTQIPREEYEEISAKLEMLGIFIEDEAKEQSYDDNSNPEKRDVLHQSIRQTRELLVHTFKTLVEQSEISQEATTDTISIEMEAVDLNDKTIIDKLAIRIRAAVCKFNINNLEQIITEINFDTQITHLATKLHLHASVTELILKLKALKGTKYMLSDNNYMAKSGEARRQELTKQRKNIAVEAGKILVDIMEIKHPSSMIHSWNVKNLIIHLRSYLKDHFSMIRVGPEAEASAYFHDLGKMSTPIRILEFKGKLEPNDRETIERHVIDTNLILKALFEDTFDEATLKKGASQHHFNYDGSGYPYQAETFGNKITPLGQLIAIFDNLEAHTSDGRDYREPFKIGESFDLIKRQAGSKFDPRYVNVVIQAFNSGAFDKFFNMDRSKPESFVKEGLDPKRKIEYVKIFDYTLLQHFYDTRSYWGPKIDEIMKNDDIIKTQKTSAALNTLIMSRLIKSFNNGLLLTSHTIIEIIKNYFVQECNISPKNNNLKIALTLIEHIIEEIINSNCVNPINWRESLAKKHNLHQTE